MGATKSAFDEDEEEEDDGRQKVELREDSISLDQVRYPLFFVVTRISDRVVVVNYFRRDELLCKALGGVLEPKETLFHPLAYVFFFVPFLETPLSPDQILITHLSPFPFPHMNKLCTIVITGQFLTCLTIHT